MLFPRHVHDKLAAHVKLVCNERMQLLQADCASIHTCSGKGTQICIGCKKAVLEKARIGNEETKCRSCRGKVARSHSNPTEEAYKAKTGTYVRTEIEVCPFRWLLSHGPLGLCHEPFDH